MYWKTHIPFLKKMLLRQERCFLSLERVAPSKSGPLGVKSGALGSAPILQLRLWSQLHNLEV